MTKKLTERVYKELKWERKYIKEEHVNYEIDEIFEKSGGLNLNITNHSRTYLICDCYVVNYDAQLNIRVDVVRTELVYQEPISADGEKLIAKLNEFYGKKPKVKTKRVRVK